MSHCRVTLNYVSGTRNQNVWRNKLPFSKFVAVNNLLRYSVSKKGYDTFVTDDDLWWIYDK